MSHFSVYIKCANIIKQNWTRQRLQPTLNKSTSSFNFKSGLKEVKIIFNKTGNIRITQH